MNKRTCTAAILLALLNGIVSDRSRGQDNQAVTQTTLSYKIALHSRIKMPLSILVLRLWTPHIKLSKEDVIRLAGILKTKYPHEVRLEVLVFDSKKEADDFSDFYEFSGYSYWRAKYWLDRSTKDEYVEYRENTSKPDQKIQRTDLTHMD
jgi:hypothetical protein